jgi:hypothetical protein
MILQDVEMFHWYSLLIGWIVFGYKVHPALLDVFAFQLEMLLALSVVPVALSRIGFPLPI